MALSHSPSIVTDGLVLCLDAANLKSYPGTGTGWTDLTNRINTSVLTNGPTYNTENLGSIVFDRVDDYVSVATATALGINDVTKNFTINLWFLGNNTTVEMQIFDNYSATQGMISLRVRNRTGEFALISSNTQNISVQNMGTGFANGTWNNFMLTWNGTSKTATLYGNTVNIGSATNTNMSGSFESGAPFYIASRPTAPGARFGGRISYLSIYNKLLSYSEILQNFNALRGRFGI